MDRSANQAHVEITQIVTSPTIKNTATVDMVSMEILIKDAMNHQERLVSQILAAATLSAELRQSTKLCVNATPVLPVIHPVQVDATDRNVYRTTNVPRIGLVWPSDVRTPVWEPVVSTLTATWKIITHYAHVAKVWTEIPCTDASSLMDHQ